MVAVFALLNKKQGPTLPEGLEVNLKLGKFVGQPSWVDKAKLVSAFYLKLT